MKYKFGTIDYESYLIEDNNIPKPVCLSFCTPEHNGVVAGMEDMYKCLNYMLDTCEVIVAHNLTFELGIILKWFPDIKSKVEKKILSLGFDDTKVVANYIDIEKNYTKGKYSLADLVYRYIHKNISSSKTDPDAWRLRYSELDGVPIEKYPAAAYQYSLMDSIYTYDLYKEFNREARLTSLSSALLNYYAKDGILIDKKLVEDITTQIEDKVKEPIQILIDNGFASYDKKGVFKKRNKKLQEYLINNFPDHIQYTDKKQISLSDEAQQVWPDDKILNAFRNYLTYQKIISSYLPALKGDKIYTEYNAAVSTGRMSSRAVRGIKNTLNVQQLPKEIPGLKLGIRECIIPKEGYKIYGIDYSGLEIACTAGVLKKIYGTSNLAGVLNSGDKPSDIHSFFAAKIMSKDKGTNVSYEQFMRHKKEPEYAKYRSLAKPIVLGIPGGGGPATIARISTTQYGVKMSEEEANDLRELYFDTFPEVRTFMKETINDYVYKTVHNKETNRKESTFKYKIEDLKRTDCYYTQLCNGVMMQSPGAFGAKKAIIQLTPILFNNPDVYFIAFVHDELVFGVKKNEKELDNLKDICHTMTKEMYKQLGVRVAVEAGEMERYTKGATLSERLFWYDSKGFNYE